MKQSIKLYNILFPVWILFLFPITWLIVIPANFAIDSAVLLIALRLLMINSKEMFKKSILKIFCFGFLSDLIGTIFLISIIPINSSISNNLSIYQWWYENIFWPVYFNPFHTITGFLWVTIAVVLSAVTIYYLNYRFTFYKSEIERHKLKRLCMALAIGTAPYFFYLPTDLFSF